MSRTRSQYWLAWALAFVLGFAVSMALLYGDLQPGTRASAAGKLGLVLLLLTGLFGIACDLLQRRWEASTARVAAWIDEFPATASVLTADPKESEWEPLFRALRLMAGRLRFIVEQANLEASRREAILACMAEGVLAVDGELRVILCNQAFADSFGARSPIPEGLTLYEVVREPALRDILESAVNGGEGAAERLQLPTAGSRWFEARALPLASSPRQGAVVVLHDITDIKHQEQVRKDFVADVSHELRTPLAAIRGYAETLLDGALDDKEHSRRFVEIILSHAIRLNNITSDLLILSEIDARTDGALPAEKISVLDVIESALNSVQNAAAQREITLDTSACCDGFIVGQRFRLEQVISNLMDNAVKFNRAGGVVRIESNPTDGGQISISVADTGVGIPQADLKRIFERFYRIDKARSRPAGGTGLGLPIVKEVVERMGGSVAVESQLGKGSKFTIVLEGAP